MWCRTGYKNQVRPRARLSKESFRVVDKLTSELLPPTSPPPHTPLSQAGARSYLCHDSRYLTSDWGGVWGGRRDGKKERWGGDNTGTPKLLIWPSEHQWMDVSALFNAVDSLLGVFNFSSISIQLQKYIDDCVAEKIYLIRPAYIRPIGLSFNLRLIKPAKLIDIPLPWQENLMLLPGG